MYQLFYNGGENMKKILYIVTLLIAMLALVNTAYGANARFNGTVEKMGAKGMSLSGGNLTIQIEKNEIDFFKDKITITLNGAVWENYDEKGEISSNISYSKVADNKIKLNIAVDEKMLKEGTTVSVPLNCRITRAQSNIYAVVNFGYPDIDEKIVGFANCEISRATLSGGIKEHNVGDKIYIKGDKSKYNNLKIKVAPNDLNITKSKIKVYLEGAEWTDYSEYGKVENDRGLSIDYKKADKRTLEIYNNDLNQRALSEGYTMTLPLTGTITKEGEIKAVVDFGTEDIDNSVVVFARVIDGNISIKADNSETPIDRCNRLSNIVITDSSTQGFKKDATIELELNQSFGFVELPKLQCSEKFKDKCKIEYKGENKQKCIITFTQAVNSGNTGTITLVKPVIERSSNSTKGFKDVEIHLTATGWEKYDSTDKIAVYQEGTFYTAPLQISVSNSNTKANKYAVLNGVKLIDSTNRRYSAGDKIVIKFDQGYRWFTKGNLPEIVADGKFVNKCKFSFNANNANEAYLIITEDINDGSAGSIEMNKVIIERNSNDDFDYINMYVDVNGDEESGATVPVAKYNSLFTYVPETTTVESASEETTSYTSNNINEKIVKFKIGDVNYSINGNNMTLLAEPYIKNGYTMLPMRALANAVGISDDKISYSDGTAVFKLNDGVEMQIKNGSSEYTLSGKVNKCSAPAEVVNGTMFLPMRDLANAIGISNDNITYDANTKEVTLSVSSN